jgi:hypothetical protein
MVWTDLLTGIIVIIDVIIIIIIIICCYLATELPLSAHMKNFMRRNEFFASNFLWHHTLSLTHLCNLLSAYRHMSVKLQAGVLRALLFMGI